MALSPDIRFNVRWAGTTCVVFSPKYRLSFQNDGSGTVLIHQHGDTPDPEKSMDPVHYRLAKGVAIRQFRKPKQRPATPNGILRRDAARHAHLNQAGV